MSRAFVKEGDAKWLHEIPPTLIALIRYLTNENNGVGVYEKKNFINEDGKEVHEMSNGFSYMINEKSEWTTME